MLCQDCPKRETCTQICKRLERHLERFTHYQREVIKPETPLEYLNFHIYPLSYKELASYWWGGRPHFSFLSELQNECLYLFYFEGLTYKQIAQKVNRKVKTVDNCIYLAKKKILGTFSKGKEGRK